MPRVIPILVSAPRWLFLATLVYAPWAYGCTRPWSIQILDGLLAVIVVLWLAGCIVRRVKPYIPWALGIPVLYVLAQGWLMIANAEAFYSRVSLRFIPEKQFLPFAPGVVDRVDCVPMMIRDTLLLGALCFVTDLVWRPVWRIRIWWTAALAGVSLVLCGLGMKIFGIQITSYLDPSVIGKTSFAFYFYHANAGAYINLVLPLVAGLAGMAFLQRAAVFERAFWLPGTLLCIAGVVATTSKGAMAVSAGLLVLLVIWFIRLAREKEILELSPARAAGLIAGCVCVIAAMASLDWTQASERWEEVGQKGVNITTSRLLVSQTCLRMMPDSNFFGFGPGNFEITFPHYTGYLGDTLAGVWKYAHEDYLQTIVEWGFIGFIPLAFIFLGGIWTGWRALRKATLALPDSVLVTMALISLAGIAVHAAFDFPLQIASIQLYVVTLLGVCWGSPLFSGTGVPGRKRRQASAAGAP